MRLESAEGRQEICRQLFQFRGFSFGFFQDGNIGVGIFPQREKILVGGAGFGAAASASAPWADAASTAYARPWPAGCIFILR